MSTFTHKLLLPGVRFTLASDVDNPLCGENGAGGAGGLGYAFLQYLDAECRPGVAQRNIAETVRRCLK